MIKGITNVRRTRTGQAQSLHERYPAPDKWWNHQADAQVRLTESGELDQARDAYADYYLALAIEAALL